MTMTQKDIDRFWSKVDVREPNNCWIFRTASKAKSYPGFWYQGEPWAAHRFSMMLFIGEEPKLSVLHTCDVPRCVNPAHLFLGTHDDNMKDMHAKGRFVPSRGNTKLTDKKVLAIRDEYAAGRTTLKELGIKYGVHFTTIQLIVKRKKWKHL